MPQTKKKSTKTARKPVTKTTHKKAASRTSKTKGISPTEKWHVYIVTSLSIIAGILLCADAAIMIVTS